MEGKQMNKQAQGFTLIELMIVVTIVAVLAAVAIPSYSDYVLKSRRSEAFQALNQVVNAMEKYKLSQNSYPADIDTLNGVITSHGLNNVGGVWMSAERNYGLIIVADTDPAPPNDWRVRATVQGAQVRDKDNCKSFMLYVDGRRSAFNDGGSNTTDRCWPD